MVANTVQSKIKKAGNADPDAFETSIAQALFELEMNSDLKAQLRELHITKAREIELNNKKVIFEFHCLLHFLNFSSPEFMYSYLFTFCFSLLLSMYQCLNLNSSKKFKQDWFENLKRSLVANMLYLLETGKFCLSQQENPEQILSRRDPGG